MSIIQIKFSLTKKQAEAGRLSFWKRYSNNAHEKTVVVNSKHIGHMATDLLVLISQYLISYYSDRMHNVSDLKV